MIDKVLQPVARSARSARRRAACTCTSSRSRSRSSATATGASAAFRYERTAPDGEGGVRRHRRDPRDRPCRPSTAPSATSARRCAGIPFDEKRGVIPNHEGQVLTDDRRPASTSDARRLRDRLDQARAGRPHRPHQVATRWRPSSTSSTTTATGGRPSRPVEESVVDAARVARHRVHRPRRLAPPRRARAWRSAQPQGRARIKVVPRDEMVDISVGDA